MNWGKGLKIFGKGFFEGIKGNDTEENDNSPTKVGKIFGGYTKDFAIEFKDEFKDYASHKIKEFIKKKEKHNG